VIRAALGARRRFGSRIGWTLKLANCCSADVILDRVIDHWLGPVAQVRVAQAVEVESNSANGDTLRCQHPDQSRSPLVDGTSFVFELLEKEPITRRHLGALPVE
jgi:hypothetical protein